MSHGIFTFDEEARVSYEKMIELVNRAESYIEKRITGKTLCTSRPGLSPSREGILSTGRVVSTLRGVFCHHDLSGGLRRFYTEVRADPEMVKSRSQRRRPTSVDPESLPLITSSGPKTGQSTSNQFRKMMNH